MDRIEPHAEVIVMTGYPDCQLHYPGFRATVITEEKERYRVEDETGKQFLCRANELLPVAD